MLNDFNRAYEESVRLVQQGVSIEECLARHPEHASELEFLLEAAFTDAARIGAAMPAMSRSRMRARILDAWDAHHAPRRSPWRFLFPLPRLAAAMAMVLIIVAFSGTGVVMAAQDAVPGQPLYSVKQIYEDARLRLSLSPDEKVSIYTQLVRERAQEIGKLTDAGAAQHAPSAMARLEGHLRDADNLARQAPAGNADVKEIDDTLLEALEVAITESRSLEPAIQTALEEVPKSTYPCIQHSLEAIQLGRERVRAAVESVEHLLPEDPSARAGISGLCSP